jgi:hypothetical protein
MKVHALAVAAVVALLSAAVSADMIDYSYHPTPSDLYELTHQNAYKWNFVLGLGADEEIVSAQLVLHGISDWTNESNVLYIHLLDASPGDPLGVTVYWDNENPTDYFAGQGIELVTYHDLPPYSQTLTHTFTAAQIATLNAYAADDIIGLGFDPDCHFYNCGIELKLTTVPEPACIVLMVAAGVPALLRRRRRLA